MTLASSKNNFLRKHGDPTLIHNVRYSHGVPLKMIVEVYDLDRAKETLPSKYDYGIDFQQVTKPSESFVPNWHTAFQKFDKSIATAKPLIAELEDLEEGEDFFDSIDKIAKTL